MTTLTIESQDDGTFQVSASDDDSDDSSAAQQGGAGAQQPPQQGQDGDSDDSGSQPQVLQSVQQVLAWVKQQLAGADQSGGDPHQLWAQEAAKRGPSGIAQGQPGQPQLSM